MRAAKKTPVTTPGFPFPHRTHAGLLGSPPPPHRLKHCLLLSTPGASTGGAPFPAQPPHTHPPHGSPLNAAMSLSCHLTEFGDLCGGSGLFARLEVPATPAEEAAPPLPLLAAGLAAPASLGRGTPGGTLSGEAGETAAEETHSTAEESPLGVPPDGVTESKNAPLPVR